MDKGSPEKTFELYLTWIRTLRCSTTYDLELLSLRNCVNFSEILHRVDDEFFTEEWVNTFAHYDQDSSWRVKAGNLKKLMKKLSEYLTKHSNRTISGNPTWVIDEQLLCEEADVEQMNKILNLIMVAALLGRNRTEFVNLVLEQSPDVQQLTMSAVTKFTDNATDVSEMPVLENSTDDVNGINSSTMEIDRVNILARENEELKVVTNKLESELEKAHEKLLHLSSAPIDQLEKEKEDLKIKKIALEERVMDMEGKLESLNNNLEVKEAELERLREKVDKIHEFEEEYIRMRDEIEELRANEIEHKKVTREYENLKQRNKDALNDKNELNVLREKNARYMEDMVALEDEKNRNKTLRQTIGSLKAQNEEKEENVKKLTIRMSKLEFELGEAKGKLITSEKKNEDHVYEKLKLQDRITELELNHRTDDSLHAALGSSLPSDEAEESRTRILDQEKEIVRLRERVRELENLEEERREWQSTKSKIKELESELQISNAKKAELIANIEKLEKDLESREFSDDINQLRVQLEHRAIELEKFAGQVQMHDRLANDAVDAKKRAEDAIAEKAKEVTKLEDNLKKATQIIKRLEQKLNAGEEGGLSRHEFDSLRKEIESKDKRIKVLEDDLEKTNTKYEEEIRLMTTHYHMISQQCHQMQTEGGDAKQSMLAKQTAANAPSFSARAGVSQYVLGIIALFLIFAVIGPLGFRGLFKVPPETL